LPRTPGFDNFHLERMGGRRIERDQSNVTPIRFSDAEQEIRRPQLKPTQYPDAKAFIPASVLLQRLHDEAPTDHFTLGWLMGRLHKRSSTPQDRLLSKQELRWTGIGP